MKTKTQHTPTPWNMNVWTSGRDTIESINGQVCELNPIHGPGTQRSNAAFIVRAVNSHEALLAIVKAIAESFNNGASQVHADALSPHSDDVTLKEWINQTIEQAEGGK